MLVSYKSRLMGWNTTTNKWEMICPTKGTPALGGEPETIDASTNEDRIQVNVLGRQSLDTPQWTANYSKDAIARIRKNYADGHVHHFAEWYGVEGDGADGIYEFDGTATVWANESDSYGLVEMTIAIGTTTPIFGPQAVATDFSNPATVLVENLYDPASTPVIATSALDAATADSAYSFTMTGANVTSWTSTALPAGLSMTSGGVISGTPTTAGTYAVTFTATGAGGSVTKTLTLTVGA